jgi:hypothetical protein
MCRLIDWGIASKYRTEIPHDSDSPDQSQYTYNISTGYQPIHPAEIVCAEYIKYGYVAPSTQLTMYQIKYNMYTDETKPRGQQQTWRITDRTLPYECKLVSKPTTGGQIDVIMERVFLYADIYCLVLAILELTHDKFTAVTKACTFFLELPFSYFIDHSRKYIVELVESIANAVDHYVEIPRGRKVINGHIEIINYYLKNLNKTDYSMIIDGLRGAGLNESFNVISDRGKYSATFRYGRDKILRIGGTEEIIGTDGIVCANDIFIRQKFDKSDTNIVHIDPMMKSGVINVLPVAGSKSNKVACAFFTAPWCEDSLASKSVPSPTELIQCVAMLIDVCTKLHMFGYVYHNFKLSNIMYNIVDGKRKYMLSDFGTCLVNGSASEKTDIDPLYMSISEQHAEYDRSMANITHFNDFESILYVMIDMMCKILKVPANITHQQYQYCIRLKMEAISRHKMDDLIGKFTEKEELTKLYGFLISHCDPRWISV